MTKLTITNVLLGLLLALNALACGNISTDQVLTMDMYGVSKTPASATGDRDPKFQIYQLTKVDLIGEDGVTATTLFDNEEDKTFRIVDREQMIYSKTISDLEGTSYSSLQLTFASEVTGGDSDGSALSFTLTNPTLTLSEAFTIEKAKDVTVVIKMNWANTLSDEAMTEPEFVLSFD